MRRIDAWVTSDGTVHTRKHDAVYYAEERYGAAVTKLAQELAVIDKYVATADFIEANLHRFVELKHLSDDRKIQEEEED